MSRDLTLALGKASRALVTLPTRTLEPPGPVPPARNAILAGLITVGLFVGGFTGWAALAPLSSAAVATGHVKVEGNRKTVQHLEGGIIRDILVREGETVESGQVLMRLDDTQSSATTDALTSQRDALLALDSRLSAERDGLARIEFPPELLARRSTDPKVNEIMTGQETIFHSRRISDNGQVQILQQQIEQSAAEIDSYEAQLHSQDQQYTLIQEELKGVKELLDKGLERKPRMLALQRQAAVIQGTRGQQQAMIARAEQTIAETQLQIAQVASVRQNEVAIEQRDVRNRLVETEEKLRAAADIQTRKDILAPIGGAVVNLRHFTVGGVIKPNEAVLDIVPHSERLVIEVQIQPTDIDVVHVGLPAEVRFPAFKQRVVPVLYGELTVVSADALTDERTGQSYYTALAEIEPEQLREMKSVTLQPGMPAEVIIATGERTLLEYLFKPIQESFHRSMRED